MKKKLIKLFCAFVLSVSCFSLATIQTEAKTTKSDKIVIKVQNKKSYKKEIKQIKKRFKSLPKLYTNKCSKVYLMDKRNFIKTAKKMDVIQPAKTNGFANYENNSIYIQLKERKNLKAYKKTLIHELAHIYDYAESETEGEGKYTGDSTFINIFQDNSTAISQYGSSDIEEFFADASYLYFQNPDKLMRKSYSVYEYLNGVYQQYDEIQ